MNDDISNYKKQIDSLKEDIELIAHIASHDIKDPLSQALENLDEAKDIETTKDLISDVIKMISILRDYSHLIKFKDDICDVDCNNVLQTALDDLSNYIEKKNVKITYDKLPKVKAFKPHMNLVFSEIIKNAILFNKSQNPKIHISYEDKENVWQFKFSDNGIGIEHFYKKYVFALFQRLEENNESQSFGAGLAFCKKIIENHGGEIWFESDGKNGTDFYFTLPK
jgi:chemotaxis family two-component system sensor kinase Cph1